MMTKQTLWVALCAVAALAGCADSTDGGTGVANGGGGDEPPQRLSCTASVSPATFEYVLDTAGETLTIDVGQADASSLNRVGAASGTIYGAWAPPDSVQSGVTLHSEIQFDSDEISATITCSGVGQTATAMASSPATITGSSVTILQADSDVEYSD
jgi:hypothetical protein